MVSKEKLISLFTEMALLLELKGENVFKVRTYERTARLLEGFKGDLEEFIDLAKSGEIKGIGEQISLKLEQAFETGSIVQLEDLRSKTPPGLLDMLRINGLGPAKVRALHEALGIKTLEELEKACLDGRVLEVKGFSDKIGRKVLAGLKQLKSYVGQFRYADVWVEARQLCQFLLKSKACDRVEACGELRRRMEVVDGMELLVSGASEVQLLEALKGYPDFTELISFSQNVIKFRLGKSIPCTIHLVKGTNFEFELFHLTGNSAHIAELAAEAKKQRIDLSSLQSRIQVEKEIYQSLDLGFIPPELREGMGEVKRAREDKNLSAKLVKIDDIHGVLHVHSTYSDGRNSLRDMVLAAKDQGSEYIGITDHSISARYASGLDLEKIEAQHREIDELNKEFSPLRVFKGIESDIRRDGSLDYSEAVLASFDFIIASVHDHWNLTKAEMTQRIIQAIKNPFTTMLGHMTGRLLLEREGYALDIEEVLKAAAGEGVAIELNCNPFRLDIDWREIPEAKELGIKIPLGLDAHSIEGLSSIEFGIGIARKGGLFPTDIPNCLGAEEFLQFCKQRSGR